MSALYLVGRIDGARPSWAVYAPDGAVAAGPFYQRKTALAVAAERSHAAADTSDHGRAVRVLQDILGPHWLVK